MYDTDTADRVCGIDIGSRSDFRYEDTTLYRTQKGAFFLAGEGGALSRWGGRVEGGKAGGGGIRPIDTADAMAFAEEAELDADRFTTLFGDLIIDA
ncbi:hypothetical protein [Pleomorphomonas sp. T1.2MG-36]|uniref:hypothetical protein n=1 Tax=Pleomorphomonas sp. T1.2MG-36 TaxID=3041167 RepID=UPI0025412031|nr:hypothetical protein [Pleomorphomonas sp. T1.2MG-36]